MKSFIWVPLCIFINQFPLLYLLIMNYNTGITDSLSYFPHVFAPLQMTTYKQQQLCSKVSVHKMKSFLIEVSSLIIKDLLPYHLDWEP